MIQPTNLSPTRRAWFRTARRRKAITLALSTLITVASTTRAEPAAQTAATDSGGERPATSSPTGGSTSQFFERSLDGAASLWERSTQSAGDWWERSRDTTLDIWDGAQRSLRPTDPGAPSRIWKEVVPKLDATLVLEDSRPGLPDRAWLGRDKRDADDDINALLDAAVAILSRSPVQRYRTEIAALRRQIADARAEIDGFRRERLAAPQESLITPTIEDFDQRIADREADIRGYLAELARVKSEFAADLRAMGLDLTEDQVDLLLATVVGDNIIDLGIVFDNVKAITEKLEQLVEESGEDLESARRYYGMYVILLRALARMHSDVSTAITERYIPRIDAIAKQADELSEETRALMREQPDRSALLKKNLEAQALTLEAAGVYRDYLIEQQRQVENAAETLAADIDTAWNTYQTVKVSGELVDLVQSSRSLLDSLLNREVPPLRPFQNLEMQRELEKLTRQIRRPEG